MSLLAIGGAVFLLSLGLRAQEEMAPQGPAVKLAETPVAVAVRGQSVTVPLVFRVANGYHINSNHPNAEYLIPTSLKVEPATDIVIGKTTYPAGQDMSFAFAPDEKLNVYTGDFTINLLVRPMHTIQTGKYAIRGSLKFQACDNKACYPPKQLPVSFDVKIVKAASAAKKNPAQSPHAHQ